LLVEILVRLVAEIVGSPVWWCSSGIHFEEKKENKTTVKGASEETGSNWWRVSKPS
jgi:hypothetical protein